MAAINLDLDKQFHFNFKRKVIIGGKTYDVIFNDKMDRVLRDLQIEMQGFFQKQTQMNEEFTEKMTVDERKQYLAEQEKNILVHVEETLDGILNKKGAGKAIYDYYDHQSYALYRTIEVLRKTKDKLDGTKRIQDQRKHDARTSEYTGKKKRVKKYYAETNKGDTE